MRLLGPIARLQIQRSSLKSGPLGRRQYVPAPLLSVPTLALDEGGATGRDEGGETVVDMHHRDHPDSKNVDGINGVSILFTAHYDAMRSRFGRRLTDGIAGESILVATDRRIRAEDLKSGVVIEGSNEDHIRLELTQIAEPCVEFTRYALDVPPDTPARDGVTDALTFLRDGMRGFYLSYRGEPATVRVGDRVYLP